MTHFLNEGEGMNLLDVIELRKKTKVPVAEYQPIRAKSKKLEEFLNGMSSGGRYNLRNNSMTLRIEGSELHKIQMMKRNLILRHGSLGETVEIPTGGKKFDLWDRLSETPKMDTSQLRKICDSLGFIIIPFDYLDPRSYQNESFDFQNGIKEFASQKEFSTYVLCPVLYYSFDRHIRSSDINKPIYAGRNSQAFMSLQMSMPFLRSVLMDLTSVKGKVKEHDSRLLVAEENIKNMSTLLGDLQRQVEEQQRELAMQRAIIAEQQAQIAEMEARMFAAMDPLMFMVEEKIDIRSGNNIAFIGPCWGPDFDEIVLAATRLSKVDGQRNHIEKIINQVWIA